MPSDDPDLAVAEKTARAYFSEVSPPDNNELPFGWLLGGLLHNSGRRLEASQLLARYTPEPSLLPDPAVHATVFFKRRLTHIS